MTKLRGSQRITGFGEQHVVRDTRGRTDQLVGGVGNQVRFEGDKGANTFHLGGFNNGVQVRNLGRDDAVILEGDPRDWERLPDHSGRDGEVAYYNSRTKNHVVVKTDGGRDDAFVEDRVRFSGSQPGRCPSDCCTNNPWDQMGQFQQMAQLQELGMILAQAMGDRAGQHCYRNQGQWGQSQSLGFDPWGSLLRSALLGF